METDESRTLARFSHRFRSFSEAAAELMEALAEALPGVVALCRADPDEGVHRVIEARGEGVSGVRGGAALRQDGDGVDAEFLRELGAGDWLSAPLEMSDGRIVGVLCAVDPRSGAYGPEHAARLGLAARLLGHEWESVELRSELRRLRARLSLDTSADPDTGLPGRDGFLELLTREWRLAERGTVQSVLVVCRVRVGADPGGDGESGAQARLALKLVAETLEATTRDTDRVGRVAETDLAAILVGCGPQDAPAFVERLLGAVERVGGTRRPQVEVACGVQALTGVPSPAEALDLAGAAAGQPEQAPAPDPDPLSPALE
jgi:GGDEF domain-containing protein